MTATSVSGDGGHDVVVVGAGIAGLAAAWALRDLDVLVLESASRVGGRMLSLPRGRHWLNLGAHLFGGPGSKLQGLVDAVGLETRPIPGNRMGLAGGGRIVASGRPETYPFRLPLPLAARWSFVTAGLRLRWAAHGYLQAAQPRPGERSAETRARALAYRDDQSFADYLGPLHPEVAGIFRAIAQRITAEPHEISAGCGAGLFALVWGDDKALARNLIGGSARLPEALAKALGARVVTGAPVDAVASEAEGVRVEGPGRHPIRAHYAIVATPAHVTGRIVRDLPADTREALLRIPYGPFVCGAFLTAETGPMRWDDLYAVATPGRSFNMLFNHANVLRGGEGRAPGGSLMVYGGGDAGRRLLELSDRGIEDAFLRDLHDLLPETRGLVREVVIQRWEHAIPYAPPGRARLQPALERSLGRIFLAGDYLEFAEMEVAVATGLEAAMRVRGRLGEPVAAAVGRL